MAMVVDVPLTTTLADLDETLRRLLKRDGMQRELGPGVVALQLTVKGALDPDGILNPGKVVG